MLFKCEAGISSLAAEKGDSGGGYGSKVHKRRPRRSVVFDSTRSILPSANLLRDPGLCISDQLCDDGTGLGYVYFVSECGMSYVALDCEQLSVYTMKSHHNSAVLMYQQSHQKSETLAMSSQRAPTMY